VSYFVSEKSASTEVESVQTGLTKGAGNEDR
jgi:hypothetical protein